MNGYNFTERVRKVLAMGREEAIRLRHEYVGTEHILLGLIREGEGVGMAVLTDLGVDTDDLRQMIEDILKTGNTAVTGPNLPYTSRAKKVLELSLKEARDMNHSYVGSEHLLVALLAEEKGIAAQALNASGVTLDAVRAETLRLLGESPTLTTERSTLTTVPSDPVHKSSGSLKPLSYSVEIEYDDGITVRRRCTSKEEALSFLMTN